MANENEHSSVIPIYMQLYAYSDYCNTKQSVKTYLTMENPRGGNSAPKMGTCGEYHIIANQFGAHKCKANTFVYLFILLCL